MLLNLRRFRGPLHRRVYAALKSAIAAGRLAPGARLPSTRALAADLGVSRNTVTLAYEQLVAEGYVVPHNRSTMSVALGLPMQMMPALSDPQIDDCPRLSAYGQRLTNGPGMPPATSYASRPGIRYDFRYRRPATPEFPRENRPA